MSYWYDIPYSSIHVSPQTKTVFSPSCRTKSTFILEVESPFLTIFSTFGTNGNFDLARRGITSAMPSSTLQLLAEITSLGWLFEGNGRKSCPQKSFALECFRKSIGWKTTVVTVVSFCFFLQIFEKGGNYCSFRSVKWVQTGSWSSEVATAVVPLLSMVAWYCLLKSIGNKLHQTSKLRQQSTNQPCMFFRIFVFFLLAHWIILHLKDEEQAGRFQHQWTNKVWRRTDSMGFF